MSRKLRTTVPAVPEVLLPKLPDYNTLACREKEMQKKQKKTFDQHHRAHALDTLMPGDLVWIPQSQTEGTVLTEVAPRSYQVTTPGGVLRRNCQQRRLLPSSLNTTSDEDTTPLDDPGREQPATDGQYRTRHGRVSVSPCRPVPAHCVKDTHYFTS